MDASQGNKHTARVLLHESRARRGTQFSNILLRWAGNARRRAAAAARTTHSPAEHCSAPHPQLELFA